MIARLILNRLQHLRNWFNGEIPCNQIHGVHVTCNHTHVMTLCPLTDPDANQGLFDARHTMSDLFGIRQGDNTLTFTKGYSTLIVNVDSCGKNWFLSYSLKTPYIRNAKGSFLVTDVRRLTVLLTALNLMYDQMDCCMVSENFDDNNYIQHCLDIRILFNKLLLEDYSIKTVRSTGEKSFRGIVKEVASNLITDKKLEIINRWDEFVFGEFTGVFMSHFEYYKHAKIPELDLFWVKKAIYLNKNVKICPIPNRNWQWKRFWVDVSFFMEKLGKTAIKGVDLKINPTMVAINRFKNVCKIETCFVNQSIRHLKEETVLKKYTKCAPSGFMKTMILNPPQSPTETNYFKKGDVKKTHKETMVRSYKTILLEYENVPTKKLEKDKVQEILNLFKHVEPIKPDYAKEIVKKLGDKGKAKSKMGLDNFENFRHVQPKVLKMRRKRIPLDDGRAVVEPVSVKTFLKGAVTKLSNYYAPLEMARSLLKEELNTCNLRSAKSFVIKNNLVGKIEDSVLKSKIQEAQKKKKEDAERKRVFSMIEARDKVVSAERAELFKKITEMIEAAELKRKEQNRIDSKNRKKLKKIEANKNKDPQEQKELLRRQKVNADKKEALKAWKKSLPWNHPF